MSRRTAIVEDDFDDDTDLPLPSRPLPNTGTKGALLEEIHISDDEFEPSPRAGPASTVQPSFRTQPLEQNKPPTVTDITPYKTWTCIYPIYLDAKRPYGTGERRVERAKSVWWPLSKDIADATNRLGLGTLHEVNKAHPRDWENPGRVRVQWKKDGKLVNPAIKSKKQLLEMISFQIQRLKPDNIPQKPFTFAPPKPVSVNLPTKSMTTKPKQLTAKTAKSSLNPTPSKPSGRRLPIPPDPQPALANRVSPYSPILPSGMLIDTVIAGMNAQENSAGAIPGAPPVAGGAGKGKRKVVRVRG
jgi:signal recognition particle subunit SRP19